MKCKPITYYIGSTTIHCSQEELGRRVRKLVMDRPHAFQNTASPRPEDAKPKRRAGKAGEAA